MNMNGLLNGAKPQIPNGTTPNPNQKSQVALPRCNDVNVIGKTGEGNKPYICKGRYLPKTNPSTPNPKIDPNLRIMPDTRTKQASTDGVSSIGPPVVRGGLDLNIALTHF